MRRPVARPAGTLGRALLVFAGWLAITVLAAPAVSGNESLADFVIRGVAWQVVFAAAFVVAAAMLFRWPDLGLGAPRWQSLGLLWLPALYIGLMLATAGLGSMPGAPLLALLLINTLFVGLSEEMMFRGVLFAGLRTRTRLWPAVAISTVAFGVVHVLNVFLTGDLVLAIAQACAAMASGLLLAAIRVRAASIWLAVGYHAIWDFATFLAFIAHAPGIGEATGQGAPDDMPLWAPILPVVFMLPIGLYGLFLLRRER